MFSPFPSAARLLAAAHLLGACAGSASPPAITDSLAAAAISGDAQSPRDDHVLRVCADPNNLPFSNEQGEGFENRLVTLLAAELGMTVQYTWFAQRRGFVRSTLGADACDVIPGIVASSDRVLVTRPYYRSSYHFVSRTSARAASRVTTLDDQRLRRLRIGVHVMGDDYTNAPPAHALAARRIIDNVRGYSIYGDYAMPDPALDLVRAVERGDLDLAIVWGPFAGYRAVQGAPLALRPVQPEIDLPFLPFVYDIAMGVRRGDTALRDRLDDALTRRRADVVQLLAEYGVPLAGSSGAVARRTDGSVGRTVEGLP